jgi:hypothetical protein
MASEMQTWWRAVVGYPPSWIAIIAVVAAVAAILILLQPPTLIALAVVAVGGVAVVVWPLTLSATGTLQQLQYRAPELPSVSEQQLDALRADLERLDDPRPAYQLQAITEKRDNLDTILDKRLQAGELTYGRYQSTAQQVYLAVVGNLREVEIARRSISAINPDYIDARLLELEAEGSVSADVEMRSLQDRRALATDQEAKVAYLLAQNESAMTLLDRTATALADAPIGMAPRDAEAAMSELEALADRAGKYATS